MQAVSSCFLRNVCVLSFFAIGKGRVRMVLDGRMQAAPSLDIAANVLADGERGLLGPAFHPSYRDNGRLFVNYTRKPDAATVIADYKVSGNPAGRGAAVAEAQWRHADIRS